MFASWLAVTCAHLLLLPANAITHAMLRHKLVPSPPANATQVAHRGVRLAALRPLEAHFLGATQRKPKGGFDVGDGIDSLKQLTKSEGQGDRQKELRDIVAERSKGTSMKCGVTTNIDANSEMGEYCPAACPVFAEAAGHTCGFNCVEATSADCARLNPDQPVADLELGICRSCRVDGCNKCVMDGTDTCAECKLGYALHDGACHNQYVLIWVIVFMLLGAIVSVVVAWVVSLFCRPRTNETGLNLALEQRSRAKLHMRKQDTDQPPEGALVATRKLWPLWTNLCREDVGGPGLLLQFNFQLLMILWAIGVAVAWYLMASNVDDELLILGTRTAETARQNCIVVAYGYETQHQFMWAKVHFCLVLYVVSFILAVLHGVRQLRVYQNMDEKSKTHKDYCAVCTGLPQLSGSEKVEEELKLCLKEATGANIIGVSVCWNFLEYEQEVHKTIEEDLYDREYDRLDDGTSTPPRTAAESLNPGASPESVTSGTRHESSQENPEEERPRVEKVQSNRSPRSSIQEPQKSSFDRLCTACAEMRTKVWDAGERLFAAVEKTFLHPTTQKIIRKGKHHSTTAKRRRTAQTENLPASSEPLATARSADSTLMAPEASEPPFSARSIASNRAGGGAAPPSAAEVLQRIQTCDTAFIVFNTESERNQAVQTIQNNKDRGIIFKGCLLELSKANSEPDTTLWVNACYTDWWDKFRFVLKGIGTIILALTIWCCCFYLPYAYYVMSFNYAHGQEPDLVAAIFFSMIVVVGNALMYFVCSEVADRVGFKYLDQREVCYMLLYTFAVSLNVLLDLAVTYFVAYQMMVGVGMRTYGGTPLAEVETFTERFETYAMQKALGEQLWYYTFPATFLIPFLIEPFMIILIPYKLMSLIVGCHPEISQPTADQYLVSTPMDLSRYADLQLNLLLAVLVFYFPGGFVVQMFGALAFSHCVIYAYDHFRVLRSIPSIEFASMDVDWWATWLLSVPCGLLLACTVFKSNCEPGHHCSESGLWLVCKCTAAAVIHVIIHTVVLIYVVPLLGRKELEPEEVPYKDCAFRIPFSWFNQNPIYCLRSQLVYEHNPPCDYCMPGKEHLCRVNPEIGAFFTDKAAEGEEYDMKKQASTAYRHSLQTLEEVKSTVKKDIDKVKTLVGSLSKSSDALESRHSENSASQPGETGADTSMDQRSTT